MPNILFYNTSTGTVLDYKLSVDEQPYLDREDVLFNPVLPANPNRSEWKVDGGELREWTQAEKDARDVANLAAVQAREAAITAALAPVKAQFTEIAVAFDDRQKRLDELLAKPDVESLTKAVGILLNDVAAMTKLLLSFQSQFEEMVKTKV
jgi:hypothetical protein